MSKDQDKCLEILRKIPPYKRIQSSFELYDFAKERLTAELFLQNPQMSEQEVKKIVKERFVAS